MGVKVTTRTTEAQTSPTAECITLHRDYSSTLKSDQFAGDEFSKQIHVHKENEKFVLTSIKRHIRKFHVLRDGKEMYQKAGW